MRLRYEFFVSACVVMLEYAHLLVSEPKGSILTKAIQALRPQPTSQKGHVGDPTRGRDTVLL